MTGNEGASLVRARFVGLGSEDEVVGLLRLRGVGGGGLGREEAYVSRTSLNVRVRVIVCILFV